MSTTAAAPDATSAALLARLAGLYPTEIDLGLERVFTLLDRLGNPHRHLPAVVHVAGTNGKGSVIATLEAMFEAAGLTAHRYTSPHLVRFHERIRLGGRDIDEATLARVLATVLDANGDAPITFFEATTAAAFLAMAETPADIVLLETGLGGRLDATNVVERPAATVLTAIDRDHVDFLGDSLTGIAAEKAAIMRLGVPCVSAAQTGAVEEVVVETATRVGAPLSMQDRDWSVGETADGLFFTSRRDRTGDGNARRFPRPALIGRHQIDNAGVALATAEILADRFPTLDNQARARGLAQARMPARLQRLARGPLVDRLKSGWALWLDGGHNAAAANAIAIQAARPVAAHGWANRPLDVIVGLMRRKEADAYLARLAPVTRRMATVTIPGQDDSFSAATLAETARAAGMAALPAASVAEALDRLQNAGASPGRVLICGSLYLAGHILSSHG